MNQEIRKPKFQQLIIWLISWGILQAVVYFLMKKNQAEGLNSLFRIEFVITLIWLISYYSSISYEILNDQIRIRKGILRYREIIIPNNQIMNAYISQSPLQKLFGVGTIHIQTRLAGYGWLNANEVKLEGIKALKQLREEIVEKATYEEIKKESLQERNSEVLRRILEELKELNKK